MSVIKYVSALHAEKNLKSRHPEVKRNPCLYFFLYVLNKEKY